MASVFVRVALRAIADPDWTMRLDLKLDAAGNIMRGEYCGVESVKETDDRFPFVLREDGQLDYGAQCEDEEERFYRSLLRTRPIVRGEKFGFVCGNDEEVYEVIKLTPLASLS